MSYNQYQVNVCDKPRQMNKLVSKTQNIHRIVQKFKIYISHNAQ